MTCPACPACTVTNAGAACAGGLVAYASPGCIGAIYGSTGTPGTCAATTQVFGSLYYDAAPPPTPSCAASAVDAGDASITLSNAVTICCAN